MWRTTNGDVLRLDEAGLMRLAEWLSVESEVLLDEIRRLAPRAARAGVVRHRRTGAVYPVFTARDGRRNVRFIARPLGRRALRPWPPRLWGRSAHLWPASMWPWPAWPGHVIVSVDPDWPVPEPAYSSPPPSMAVPGAREPTDDLRDDAGAADGDAGTDADDGAGTALVDPEEVRW